MKNITIKKLQEAFVGKVCTILTKTVGKTNFKDEQFADFFTGVVESLDEDGVFTRHHITGCLNYYFFSHIVAILEEQVILESDPNYKKIVEEIKNPPKPAIQELPQDNSKFINTDFMSILAQNAKRVQQDS